ncbi:MarR family winged helix-turn-helix transcriptional regulator [Actinomadura sp. 21ATH]|uniref:MarR family winged helix-turn-helix transcriptional regulator n=1 Tax=Actinomadura sp. 21ATH TaxID=1735444 RepID=UPI0035BFFDF5
MNSSANTQGDGAVRLDDMVCFDLHAASRAMTAVYRPLLEPLGLTYPQYLVLAALWENGDLPVRELVRLLQLDYGTMTPLLKRLEGRGLLRRTRNPSDERTVIVALTGDGDALRRHAPGIYQRICDVFGFTPERAREAQDLLRFIVERANQVADADAAAGAGSARS